MFRNRVRKAKTFISSSRKLGMTAVALLAITGAPKAASAAVYYSNSYVSGITQTGVDSLNTTLDSTSGLVLTATFNFGTTSAWGTIYAGSTGANNVPAHYNGSVSSVAISGLTCGTTYHWSVEVSGIPDVDQTFTTLPCPSPAISVSPSPKAYGTVAVNQSSAQSFTITNTGTANLNVSGVTVGGADAAMFALSLGTCSSLTPTLVAGNSCTVIVTFSPSSVGTRSATLQLASNASGSPTTVTLAGAGAAGGGSVPTLGEWGMLFLCTAFAMLLLVQARRTGIPGSPA
jgi:hypothetical protein